MSGAGALPGRVRELPGSELKPKSRYSLQVRARLLARSRFSAGVFVEVVDDDYI
jgi:hypothetical protein